MWVTAAHTLLPQLGHKIVDINDSPDVILIAGIGSESGHLSAAQLISYKHWRKSTTGQEVKLIFRVNENDARKGTNGVDSTVRMLSDLCDHTVFVSKWLQDYFSSLGTKSSSYIHNGVDTDIFKINEKLGGKKINIVTHHWSDNYMKGFDIYEKIDSWLDSRGDQFTFTYIGRERGTFRNCRVIKPLFGNQLGQELGKYDVYVSGSRYDPGPNHVIESIACKIPTYVHIDGGGGVEFAGSDHTYSSVDDLLNILEGKIYTMNSSWSPTDWNVCISKFEKLMREISENSL